MRSVKKEKVIPFRTICTLIVVLSVTFIIIGVARFFKIDFILDLLPEITREVLHESPTWVYYVYLITISINSLAVVLLLRRNIFTVPLNQLAAGGMVLLILYHYFSTEVLYAFTAVEMLITLAFYISLAWFASYANETGHLLKSTEENTTVLLKVQEGCNHACAYCPVPSRKGKSRSNSVRNITQDVWQMAEEGIREVVISGDNVGDFGTGEYGDLDHDHTFLDLLKELDPIKGIERFRFLSVTTPMFSKKTLKFIKESSRLSNHFNIRMDSGSNEMLKKMNRPYLLAPYKELFKNIKKLMPDAFISVEILVGFPGETEDLFMETYNCLSELDISFISTQTYVDKLGTPAFNIRKNVVPKPERAKRRRKLIELSKKKLHTFYESQIDKEMIVLFENKNKKGYIYGYTDNFIKVKTAWKYELESALRKVRLTEINGSFMSFEYLETEKIIEEQHFSI